MPTHATFVITARRVKVARQRLADRQIRVNGWLSEPEVVEIRRRIEDPISNQEGQNVMLECQRN